MRTVLVLMDTLRRDALSCYNENTEIKTPNLDDFSKNSTVFTNHWIGSAPCMPARRDIFTGRMNFLERSWGPIEAYDETLMDILKENDIFTHISTDHCHYMRLGGEGYLQKFNTWDFIRGQEGDPWVSSIDDPLNIPESFYGRVRRQYQLNREKWEDNKEDYPSPRTFKSGIDWLDRNGKNENYFLMIEAFDPHEPFDVPEEFLNLYPDVELDKDYFEIPNYGKNDLNEQALKYLVRRYKALVSMSDFFFGKLIDKLKELKIYEDTLLIVTTDHGFLFGEHGYNGKNIMPLFNEISHLPLLVHFPGSKLKGEKIDKITQNIDIAPTILDFNGIKSGKDMLGKSWKNIVDNVDFKRKYALFGYHGMQMNLATDKYVYMRAPVKNNKPLYEYTTSLPTIRGYLGEGNEENVECGYFINRCKYPVYKVPIDIPSQIKSDPIQLDLIRKSYIFDYINDKKQEKNLYDNKELREKLNKLMVKALKENDSPEEQYDRMNLKEYM